MTKKLKKPRKECGAKRRNKDSFCKGAPMRNGRCRLHGGASPSGILSPHFKHGRYSKHLPDKLLLRYEEAKNDPALIELRDEIALVDTHLSERLERLYEGESVKAWEDVQIALRAYLRAKDQDNPEEQDSGLSIIEDDPAKRLATLERTISKGKQQFLSFESVQPLIEQRRKLIDTEAKRLKDLNQNITAEKAMVIIYKLADIVKKHVTDPQQLKAISTELADSIT